MIKILKQTSNIKQALLLKLPVYFLLSKPFQSAVHLPQALQTLTDHGFYLYQLLIFRVRCSHGTDKAGTEKRFVLQEA